MAEIDGYLVPTACFMLLFLGATLLFEKYSKRVHPILLKRFGFLTKGGWHPQPIENSAEEVVKTPGIQQKFVFFASFWKVLVKISGDTVIKSMAVAGFILCARKLIYYVPLNGVIQSKFSIWQVDGNAQTLIIISILLVLMIGLGWKMLKSDIEEKMFGIELVYLAVLGILVLIVIQIISKGQLKIQFPITGQHLITIVFAPFLLLKILCLGEYTGLLTGFFSGYLMVVGYKKLKKETIKPYINMMIAAGFMFLIFLCFSFYQSLGNWQVQFNYRVQSAQTRGEIEELLDAVNTIDNEDIKSNALQQLAVAISGTGDSQWKKERLQQAIGTSRPIENSTQRSKALKEIAVAIGKTGDFSWAVEVAMNIPVKKIRDHVLTKLLEKKEER